MTSVATVILLLLAVCAANMTGLRAPSLPANESNEQRCTESRGSCIPWRDCHNISGIISFFCRRPHTACCISKKQLCENIYEGFCMNDTSKCQPEKTHLVSELRCDADSKCCVSMETLRLRQDWGTGWGFRSWSSCRRGSNDTTQQTPRSR